MQFGGMPCIYIHRSCLKHRFLPRNAATCPSCTAARRVGPTADGAPERISVEVRFECVLKERLQSSQILRSVYCSIRFPICFCQSSFYRSMQHFIGNFIPALPAGDFPCKNRRGTSQNGKPLACFCGFILPFWPFRGHRSGWRSGSNPRRSRRPANRRFSRSRQWPAQKIRPALPAPECFECSFTVPSFLVCTASAVQGTFGPALRLGPSKSQPILPQMPRPMQ